MLDIKFIRQNPDKVKDACRKKQVKVDVDKLLEIDKKRRLLMVELEAIKAKKNKASREISALKSEAEKKKIIKKMQGLDKDGDKLAKKLRETEKEFTSLMLMIPNPPLEEVIEGKDDSENKVLREIGERPKFDFPYKDYLELGEKLNLIDVKRAAKTSGSRFGFIKNEAALMEFALVKLAFDLLRKEGFELVVPPVLIKPEPFRAMGYLERGSEEVYYFPKDDLYLIGTSEQIIGPMHLDEIFEESDLPKRYAGFSSCFRREAGASGKDTKGILRVHQFDKIEMFSFCLPEKSREEHQLLLSLEEKLMQLLKLPYHVLDICSGDLGDPAAAKYDIEAWIPSENRYRETHSTSNCTDFQARRLNIRFRDKTGKLNFVHTLNGTAFAIPRLLIVIIENYQQKDGSIRVPTVLQSYLGKIEIK